MLRRQSKEDCSRLRLSPCSCSGLSILPADFVLHALSPMLLEFPLLMDPFWRQFHLMGPLCRVATFICIDATPMSQYYSPSHGLRLLETPCTPADVVALRSPRARFVHEHAPLRDFLHREPMHYHYIPPPYHPFVVPLG